MMHGQQNIKLNCVYFYVLCVLFARVYVSMKKTKIKFCKFNWNVTFNDFALNIIINIVYVCNAVAKYCA
jgi:hypothetical protein